MTHALFKKKSLQGQNLSPQCQLRPSPVANVHKRCSLITGDLLYAWSLKKVLLYSRISVSYLPSNLTYHMYFALGQSLIVYYRRLVLILACSDTDSRQLNVLIFAATEECIPETRVGFKLCHV